MKLFGENLVMGKRKVVRNVKAYENLGWQIIDGSKYSLDAILSWGIVSDRNRSASPQEVMSIMIDYENDEILPGYEDIADNVNEFYGEFFSTAAVVTDNTLYLFDGVFNDDSLRKLDINGQWYPGKSIFNIDDVKKGELESLEAINEKCPELIEHLYTQKFDELPDQMQKNGGIFLPSPDKYTMLARSTLNPYSIVVGHGNRMARMVTHR